MTPIEAMEAEIERRMRRGERFSDVEDAIDASELAADAKAALWLLAWSYVDWRAQRREARAHVAVLKRAESAAAGTRRQALRLVEQRDAARNAVA